MIDAMVVRKELRRRILQEIRNRDISQWANVIKLKILESLHDKQRLVIQDIQNGHRFIALCTSRRAGKTITIVAQILISLIDAKFNETVMFIAPTIEKGKKLIWSELKRQIELFELPFELKEGSGEIVTPAGGKFEILGLSSSGKAEMPRGATVRAAFLDETQDMTHLLPPLLSSLGPALSTVDGILVLSGTPSPQPVGPWYEIVEKQIGGFRKHHFTILDNTKLEKPARQILDEELARMGWDEQTPEFRREYLGEWVPDDSQMVFSYNPVENNLNQVPNGYSSKWIHCMGIDLGFNDYCGWVVCAKNPQTGEIIVLHSEKHPKLFSYQAMEITKRLVNEYGLQRIVCDPAAGGTQFYHQFNAEYGQLIGVGIRPANKMDKKNRIANTNSLFRSKRLKVLSPGADSLIYELQTIRYKNRNTSDFLTSSKLRDDLLDPLMYALVDLGMFQARHEEEQSKVPNFIDLLFTKKEEFKSVQDEWSAANRPSW